MANTELAFTELRPTGDRLLTPPIGDSGARLVLEGVFTFRYSGMQFDALYRTGPDGAFSQRHSYLDWSPSPPLLDCEEVARHRYQFLIPAAAKRQGQSVGLRVDLDRFVDEFLIPPSEVRAGLTGVMMLRVLPLAGAPVSPWAAIVGLSVPAAVMLGGVGWVLRRRLALSGLPHELQLQLERISRKQRAARAALGSGPLRCRRLDENLSAVQAGAWTLARQIRVLARARSHLDQPSLQAEAQRLELDLVSLTDAAALAAGVAALAEKRKTLALLEEIAITEARCAMRLTGLEATLDTACLTLRHLQPAMSAPSPVDALRREMEAELTALAQVAREIATLETRAV
jgi:hypothetical protein